MNTQKIQALQEKKLIWSGTVGEAIKQGKLTQEEVDNWYNEDDEERIIKIAKLSQAQEDKIEFEKFVSELKGEYEKLGVVKHSILIEVINNLSKRLFNENSQDNSQETKDGQGFGTRTGNSSGVDGESVMGSEWSSSPDTSSLKPKQESK